MSDRRLRELERRWRSAGDLDAEIALVQALLRRGLLPRPRLLLAAYLGSPGAARSLGGRGFPEEPNLETWVAGLGKGRLARSPDLARASAVRAALAALDLVASHDLLSEQDAHAAALARDWLEEPTPEGVLRVHGAAAGGEPFPSFLASTVGGRDCELAARSAAYLARAAATTLRLKERHHLKRVRRAIYDALVVWALTDQG